LKALHVLSDVLYASKPNCTLFSSLMLHLEDSTVSVTAPLGTQMSPHVQPAMQRLLKVVLNGKELSERIAAVRVFKSFLYENDEAQLALASTLTPPPTITEQELASIGTELLNGLLDWEKSSESLPYRSWFCSMILSYILKDNLSSKELVLKIPLEIPKPGIPMVTLLIKCLRTMQLVFRIQPSKQTLLVKIQLLRLVATWLDGCVSAVKAYLSSSASLPMLFELVVSSSEQKEGVVHIQGLCTLVIGLCFYYNEDSNGGSSSQFNRSSLHSIIVQRIGIDQFLTKLDSLRKTEHFLRAEQGLSEMDRSATQWISLQSSSTSEESSLNFYDYDFTVFFKSACEKIQKQLKSPKQSIRSNEKDSVNARDNSNGPVSLSSSQNASMSAEGPLLQSYKELIRQQERELEILRQQNHSFEVKLKELERKSLSPEPVISAPSPSAIVFPQTPMETEFLRKSLQEKDVQLNALQQETEELRKFIEDQSKESLSLSQAVHTLEQMCIQKEKELEHWKAMVNRASSSSSSVTNNNE